MEGGDVRAETRAAATPAVRPRATAQRAGRILIVSALVAAGIWTVRDFLPALGWASVLTIATWPLYRRFRAALPVRRFSLLPPLVFSLLVAAVFLVPLVLGAVEAAREAHLLLRWLATVQTTGVPAPDWLATLPRVGPGVAAWWQSHLGDPEAAADLIDRIDRDMFVGWTRTLGLQLVHRLMLLVFTLLALFFLLRDGEGIAERLLTIGDRVLGSRGERLALSAVSAVHGTVNGLVLVGLGEGALLGVAYAIAGVPHPALTAALTAILAVIPFGAPAIYTVASLMLLAGESATAGVAVFVAGTVVVFVADHFVRPVLIGGAARLPFLWVLLGILGGLESYGLLGLFLGPALMAALITLWREWTALPPDDAV